MFIVGGRATYGKVDNRDGSYDETLFVHLFGVPVVPLMTTRTDASGQSHRIPLRAASVALGYLRVAGLPLGAFAVWRGLLAMMMHKLTLGWFTLLFGALLVVATAASWTWLGRAVRRSARIVLAHSVTGLPLLVALGLAGIVTAATLHSDEKSCIEAGPQR